MTSGGVTSWRHPKYKDRRKLANGAMTNKRLVKIINSRLTQLTLRHHRLHIYGSATTPDPRARDIDAVLTSPRLQSLELLSTTAGDTPINLYLVPDAVMLDDIATWSRGGFYAHKYALGCRLLSSKGDTIDMASVFWKNESAYHQRSIFGVDGITINCHEAIRLIRACHSRILRHRPTFARALANYAHSPSRQMSLTTFVRNAIVQQTAHLRFPLGRRSYETAFIRFWREYNYMKTGSHAWSDTTFKKMARSVAPVGLESISDYMD
jgi:hypothetical protein